MTEAETEKGTPSQEDKGFSASGKKSNLIELYEGFIAEGQEQKRHYKQMPKLIVKTLEKFGAKAEKETNTTTDKKRLAQNRTGVWDPRSHHIVVSVSGLTLALLTAGFTFSSSEVGEDDHIDPAGLLINVQNLALEAQKEANNAGVTASFEAEVGTLKEFSDSMQNAFNEAGLIIEGPGGTEAFNTQKDFSDQIVKELQTMFPKLDINDQDMNDMAQQISSYYYTFEAWAAHNGSTNPDANAVHFIWELVYYQMEQDFYQNELLLLYDNTELNHFKELVAAGKPLPSYDAIDAAKDFVKEKGITLTQKELDLLVKHSVSPDFILTDLVAKKEAASKEMDIHTDHHLDMM